MKPSIDGGQNSPLIDVGNDFEGSLDAIFVDLASLESSNISLAREAKDIESVFASKSDELSALGPVNLSRISLWLKGESNRTESTHVLGLDFDPADELTRFPVKETDTALALDTEKHTTTEAFGLETNVEHGLLLEIAEDLDAHG